MRLTDLPVDPDAPEARRWLIEELSRPEYREAEPTWFDLAAQAVRDWLFSLFEGGSGLPGPVIAALAIIVVGVLVVVGLVVFGLPRRRRRRAASAQLFDEGDARSLAELRRAADAAAAAGRLDEAIEERFRAIVRALVDRELVHVHPGTTAHGFSVAAAAAFPSAATRLDDAATVFDAVRYLGRPGTPAEAAALAALDADLERTVPVTEPVTGSVAAGASTLPAPEAIR